MNCKVCGRTFERGDNFAHIGHWPEERCVTRIHTCTGYCQKTVRSLMRLQATAKMLKENK